MSPAPPIEEEQYEPPVEGFWAGLKRRIRGAAAAGIVRLQDTFPVNRVVIILTPILFAPAAAGLAGWWAQNFPGLPQFSEAQVLGAMGVGAATAIGFAYSWLKQWQRKWDDLTVEVTAEGPAEDFLNETDPSDYVIDPARAAASGVPLPESAGGISPSLH